MAAASTEAKAEPVYEWPGDGRLFNGSNSIVEPSSAAYKLTDAFTLMIWAKPTKGVSDWNRLFGKGAPNPRNYGIWLSSSYGNDYKAQLLSQIYKGGPTSQLILDEHVQSDAWTHLAARYVRESEVGTCL